MLISSSQGSWSPSNAADSPAVIEPNTSLFESIMSKYWVALQAYIKLNSPHFTPKEEIAIAVLKLHALSSYLTVYVEHSPPDKKASWEEFTPHIKEMVRLSELVLSPANGRGPTTTSFCSDMGILLPLYTLGSQCREPTIRRKVIGLLRSTARQESFLNSFLVANALERIMEIEGSVSPATDECCTDAPADQATPSSMEPFHGLDGKGSWAQYILCGEL
jgi:hypothetical protein